MQPVSTNQMKDGNDVVLTSAVDTDCFAFRSIAHIIV